MFVKSFLVTTAFLVGGLALFVAAAPGSHAAAPATVAQPAPVPPQVAHVDTPAPIASADPQTVARIAAWCRGESNERAKDLPVVPGVSCATLPPA